MNAYKFQAQYQRYVNLAMLYVLYQSQSAVKVRELCQKVSELVGDSPDVELAVKEAGLNDDDLFQVPGYNADYVRGLEIEMNVLGIELAKQLIINQGGTVTRVQLTTPPVIYCTPVNVRPVLFGCTLVIREAV